MLDWHEKFIIDTINDIKRKGKAYVYSGYLKEVIEQQCNIQQIAVIISDTTEDETRTKSYIFTKARKANE